MSEGKIVLYGAGDLGENTYRHLLESGYDVAAFLDQHVTGSVNGVPVFRPEQIRMIKEDFVVLICLSNGLLHKEVADQLYQYGCNKIIFLPLGFCIDHQEKNRLIRLYNRALTGEFSVKEVIDYEEYISVSIRESAVIREENGLRTVWMGQEIVFSENYWEWKGDFSKIHFVNNGVPTNLSANYWRHELFQFLGGERDECSHYLEIFGCTDDEKGSVKKIKEREKLYREFKRLLSFGIDSFIEMAPKVIWNRNGYFTIVGGHHRLIFLQSAGYTFLPVKISDDDYEIWVNKEKLFKIEKFIQENQIKETYVPIPHPYFRYFPAFRELHGNTVLQAVLNSLGTQNLDEKRVLDMSQYEGYFARAVSRMSAKKVECYLKNIKEQRLSENIADLLHIDNIEFYLTDQLTVEDIKNADILFAMKNIEILLENNILDSFKGILFLEFNAGERGLVNKVLAILQMYHYEALYKEVVEGELLEVGRIY